MKPTLTALGLALALGATPAAAVAIQQPAAQAEPKKVKLSGAATKAITELQAAVNANDTAAIPGKLAAAQAAAKTADDRYAIALMQFRLARNTKDPAATSAAIDAMIASGHPTALAQAPALQIELGSMFKAANQPDQAAAAYEKALAADPTSVQALVNLAETRNAQGRAGEAMPLLQKAIEARSAGGQKADEDWYKRAVSIGYAAKLPATMEQTRRWIVAYPSPTSWRDSMVIYRSLTPISDSATLDSLRLQRATKALTSETDFDRYASSLINAGLASEAKAVVDEGVAAGKVTSSEASALLARAAKEAAAEKAKLAKAGQGTATAAQLIAAGDVQYGQGDFAKAAETYRAAAGKGGNKDLANLRLGMALARSGDKAGATAALNAVGGSHAELAKYWLLFVNQA